MSPSDPSLRFDSDGFDVIAGNDGVRLARVSWAKVSRVTAYKVDLITTDCVCVLFEQSPEVGPIQISEAWAGFGELSDELRRRLPSIGSDWHQTVALPAFERNETTLYERFTHDHAAV